MNKWHVPELSDLEKRLKSDFSEGLSAREANERLEKAQKQSRGHSKSLFVPRRRSFWFPLFSFVGSPLTVLLLLISFLTTIFGRPYLGILVFILTLAAAIYCGVVSLRAERRLDKMREYASGQTIRICTDYSHDRFYSRKETLDTWPEDYHKK